MKRYWNYRILAHKIGNEITLQVHEVHYKDDIPVNYGTEPANIAGWEINEIWHTIERIKECYELPILWAGDKFPQIYKP